MSSFRNREYASQPDVPRGYGDRRGAYSGKRTPISHRNVPLERPHGHLVAVHLPPIGMDTPNPRCVSVIAAVLKAQVTALQHAFD